MNLSDARICITGGSGGIGNFLSSSLAAKAARVIIIDKASPAMPGPGVEFHACDLTSYDAVKSTVARIFETEGVNVLINNAGVIHSEPLVSLVTAERVHSVDNWKRVIDINLNAVFYVTSQVVNQMILKKTKGVIINVSSISAGGNIGQSAYSATKAALEALTVTWSKELSMFKIRSVGIAPGFFDTPSTRASLSEAVLARWEKAVPLGRLGQLEEILSAIEFLVGNEYYNGRTLSLDGGLRI